MGFCFDFYRILRWQMRFNTILTFIGDLIFSLTALGLIYFFAQKANYLELRFYLFLGSLLGLLLYFAILSRIVIKILKSLVNIFCMIKKAITVAISFLLKSIYTFVAGIMSIPYHILRWFALLTYRIGETLGKDSVTRVQSKLFRMIKR